jgi:hypothetical protein
MMTVNDEGERPVWADESMEISNNGDLVRIAPRPVDAPLNSFAPLTTIASAHLNGPEKPVGSPE